MTDQVKYTSTWPQGVPPRIPSLEESRSAHKIASAQPEGFNKDSEVSHSFTESSVSTSIVIENKSYAEAVSNNYICFLQARLFFKVFCLIFNNKIDIRKPHLAFDAIPDLY